MSTARERIQATLDIDEARRVLVLSEDLRALLAETAPTDDVREALIAILLDEGLESARGYGQPTATDVADAILSAFRVTPKEEQ